MKRKYIIAWTGVVLLSLATYCSLFLYSSSTPDHWEDLASGMNRYEIRDLIKHSDVTFSHEGDGRDHWSINRPIGEWSLFVSYNKDDSFHLAQLRYTSIFDIGNETIGINYNENHNPIHLVVER